MLRSEQRGFYRMHKRLFSAVFSENLTFMQFLEIIIRWYTQGQSQPLRQPGPTALCSDGEAGKRMPVHPPISAMAGSTGGDFIEYGHSESTLGSLVGDHRLPSLGFIIFRWFLRYPAILL